jgi:Required for nuclear transport of RNA pol II C-terminus 1
MMMTSDEEDLAVLRTIACVQRTIDWIRARHWREEEEDGDRRTTQGRRRRQQGGGGARGSAPAAPASAPAEEEEEEEKDHDRIGSSSSSRSGTAGEDLELLLRELVGTVAALRRPKDEDLKEEEEDPATTGRGTNSTNSTNQRLPPWIVDLLVDRVLIPLVEALAASYLILDRMDDDDNDSMSSETSMHNHLPSANPQRQTNQNQQPPPPRGLLSLHQYADVAALIECAVVAALVVVPSASSSSASSSATESASSSADLSLLLQTRARQLPRSIVGRLSPPCLVDWGMATVEAASTTPRNVMAGRMRRAVAAVGQLLLLDRFRGMLLPRHLPDLYLGIFWLEEHEEQPSFDDEGCQGSSSLEYRSVRSQLLPSSLFSTEAAATAAASISSCQVDAVWQARACQALLASSSTTRAGGGTAHFAGLRSSASRLLSHVAATDLPALLHVFVPPSTSSPGGDASLGLARAILAPPHKSNADSDAARRSIYLQNVAAQVAILLDAAADKDRRQRDNCSQRTTSGRIMIDGGVLATLWALLDGMPCDYATLQLGSHVDTETLVGRWHVLLSFVPPFVPPRKVLQLLLQVPNGSSTNESSGFMVLVQQVIQDTVLHSPAKDVARDALQYLIQWSSGVDATRKNAKASHLLAVACLHAAVMIDNDVSLAGTSMEAAVAAIEHRFRALVINLFVPVMTQSRDHDHNGENPPMSNVVSFMFRLLLEMYLQNHHDNMVEDQRLGANAEFVAAQRLRLVPLVALPILCEECPLESLLQSSTHILELMSVTFQEAARLVRNVGEEELRHTSQKVEGHESQMAVKEYCTISGTSLFNALEIHSKGSVNATLGSSDTIFTLCSLLLGVLIGILELGARNRCDADEAMLQTFPAKLLPLARTPAVLTADVDVGILEAIVEIPTELASMASHAMALILARQAPAGETNASPSGQPASTSELLSRCQEDLQSDEVPIRARAVVSLRHVACALLDSETPSNDLYRVLIPLMESLKDSDSYVYLAAIQTIAFLADAAPKFVLPIIGRAVETSDLIVDNEEKVQLSSEQRVKLAEALASSIRRKVAVHEYLSLLLDVMIFGGAASDLSYESSKENGVLIQEATHHYFLKVVHHDLDDASDEDRWDETDVRLRTGGPLFEEEENELVRAAKLSVVTELVMASQPAVLSRYCHTLVRCSIGCLQQGRSRPIRRSGALLARELYAAAIREHDEQVPVPSNCGETPAQGIPFSVAMVSAANEKSLALALERCLNHEDVNDLGVNQQRLADPATSARCQEALQARAEAEETGILPAGRIIAESEASANSQPLLQMLLEPSRNEDPTPSRSLTHMIVEM